MAFLRKMVDAGHRALAEFARRQDGGPAVEFASVAWIIIVLIFVTAQVAVIYFADSYLESAAEEGARLVLTNQTGSMTAAQFKAAICSNITMLFNCSNVMVGLSPVTSNTSINTAVPAFNANGTLASSMPYTQPAQGQIAVLQVLYQWPVVGGPLGFNFVNMGNGTYLMMSTQVFMVETQ